MTVEPLPSGWSIELVPGTRRTDGGAVLVGGAPLRVLRLSDEGVRWLDEVEAGGPLPDSPGSRRLARRLVDAGVARARPPAGAGARRDEVAVVVPVRDDPAGLGRTLAGLGAGALSAIVVVDDASSDADAVAAVAEEAGAVVVRDDRRLGPSGARERGWRSSAAPVIAFLDADVEPFGGDGEPAGGDGDGRGHWLEAALAHFDDPAVGAVAPRVRVGAGPGPSWLRAYEEVRSPLDMGAQAAVVRPGGTVAYVPTAALVVRRAALEAVGGFDPALEVGEDVDLVWRLVGAGWRVHYEPAAVVCHPIRPGPGAWLRQRFAYGTSAAPLAARHGDKVAPLRLSGWSALAWAAVLARRPRIGAGTGIATTAAMVPKLARLQHPLAESLRIAGVGNLRAGEAVADVLWRAWWPVSLAVALGRRRGRTLLAAALVLGPLLEWRRRRPAMGPAAYVAVRRADDVAYGAGVWVGCLRSRSLRALLPSFTGPMAPPAPVGGQ